MSETMVQQDQPAEPRSDLIIRRYAVRDIPIIIEKVKQYLPEMPHYKGISVHDERLNFLLTNNITNTGVFFLDVLVTRQGEPVGGLCGFNTPAVFSTDRVANDIFFFIEPAYRTLRNAATLIRAFTEWSKAHDAKIIIATHTGGDKQEGMDALLTRYGYYKAGSIFHYRAV